MEHQYKLAVYIGRFQPYHRGHYQTLMEGFKLAPKVLVLVGSIYKERTLKNPFFFEERKQMILDSVVPPTSVHSLKVESIIEYPSDVVWANNVDDIVKKYEKYNDRITLIGDYTDPDSKYIDLFGWTISSVANIAGVHATAIRSLYFSSKLDHIKSMIPESTYQFLFKFRLSNPEWSRLCGLYSEEKC
jgi:bifunctional NMN adenylyltransferase/nudix hydrolase